MQSDLIEAIGIDDGGSLWLKPSRATFPLIHLETMEVRWDVTHQRLYAPKPREWSYVDWFRQIVTAARAQGTRLTFTGNTFWANIGPELQRDILAIALLN